MCGAGLNGQVVTRVGLVQVRVLGDISILVALLGSVVSGTRAAVRNDVHFNSLPTNDALLSDHHSWQGRNKAGRA